MNKSGWRSLRDTKNILSTNTWTRSVKWLWMSSNLYFIWSGPIECGAVRLASSFYSQLLISGPKVVFFCFKFWWIYKEIIFFLTHKKGYFNSAMKKRIGVFSLLLGFQGKISDSIIIIISMRPIRVLNTIYWIFEKDLNISILIKKLYSSISHVLSNKIPNFELKTVSVQLSFITREVYL
jgi:hypothetical protein